MISDAHATRKRNNNNDDRPNVNNSNKKRLEQILQPRKLMVDSVGHNQMLEGIRHIQMLEGMKTLDEHWTFWWWLSTAGCVVNL